MLVWAGIPFNRRTQLYAINENLNSKRYSEEILRPIVMPFLRGTRIRSITLGPTMAALLMTLCSETPLLGWTGLQAPLI